ncbi:MAG TPA: hypothetical protein VEP90_22450, partial [Methylomirabilota bacterium]|nr:hypothetical protein [Methylomirabilota bacterium]
SLSVRESSIQTPIYKQMSSFWMWRKANYTDFDSFRMSLVVALLYLVLMFVGDSAEGILVLQVEGMRASILKLMTRDNMALYSYAIPA